MMACLNVHHVNKQNVLNRIARGISSKGTITDLGNREFMIMPNLVTVGTRDMDFEIYTNWPVAKLRFEIFIENNTSPILFDLRRINDIPIRPSLAID